MKPLFSPFRVGANFLIISALTLSVGVFAQRSNTGINPQVNYSDQLSDNNFAQAKLPANDDAQVQSQAAGGNPAFGISGKEKKPCDDCAEVKAAIKASKSISSHGGYVGRKFSMSAWHQKVSGRTSMKLRKIFSRSRKVRTGYDICFNWK